MGSSDFLASDFCYGVEMTRAMQRHEIGTARVIPVILRPCDWHSAPFGKLLATPIDLSPELRRISGSVTGHQTPQKSTSRVSTKPDQLQLQTGMRLKARASH
jgi:hypothetical protein